MRSCWWSLLLRVDICILCILMQIYNFYEQRLSCFCPNIYTKSYTCYAHPKWTGIAIGSTDQGVKINFPSSIALVPFLELQAIQIWSYKRPNFGGTSDPSPWTAYHYRFTSVQFNLDLATSNPLSWGGRLPSFAQYRTMHWHWIARTTCCENSGNVKSLTPMEL